MHSRDCHFLQSRVLRISSDARNFIGFVSPTSFSVIHLFVIHVSVHLETVCAYIYSMNVMMPLWEVFPIMLHWIPFICSIIDSHELHLDITVIEHVTLPGLFFVCFFLIYLLTFCFYLCICVFVFVSVCHMYMGACGDQKRVSGARVIGNCDCLYGCWEFNLGSLERNKHHSFPCINKPDTAYLEWCCCEFLFGWLVGLVCFFWGGGIKFMCNWVHFRS